MKAGQTRTWSRLVQTKNAAVVQFASKRRSGVGPFTLLGQDP